MTANSFQSLKMKLQTILVEQQNILVALANTLRKIKAKGR